jgi:hypothetical protein
VTNVKEGNKCITVGPACNRLKKIYSLFRHCHSKFFAVKFVDYKVGICSLLI